MMYIVCCRLFYIMCCAFAPASSICSFIADLKHVWRPDPCKWLCCPVALAMQATLAPSMNASQNAQGCIADCQRVQYKKNWRLVQLLLRCRLRWHHQCITECPRLYYSLPTSWAQCPNYARITDVLSGFWYRYEFWFIIRPYEGRWRVTHGVHMDGQWRSLKSDTYFPCFCFRTGSSSSASVKTWSWSSTLRAWAGVHVT